MADTTQFGHDELGHILVDRLLEVPRFQRSFSWDTTNVKEYLADLERARHKNVNYFMGTVVFARSDGGDRLQIVDGQQRLATTAILYVAIRDELRRHEKDRQAEELEKRFLRGYVISADEVLERLILNNEDVPHYSKLLDNEPGSAGNRIFEAHQECLRYLRAVMGPSDHWEVLIEISEQLEKRVQVLVAEASDLPEAYVIFETLNDRGADLTTADLLKNYLFSSAQSYFRYIEAKWIGLESSFERPEDLVKFLRYEFSSRHGSTSGRKLYRAIQEEVDGSASKAKAYATQLSEACTIYLALKDPDSDFWSDSSAPVRDALFAYRRFGFESSLPALMAAFTKWPRRDADKLLVKMAKWSVRAQIAGTLGGGTADEVFGNIAEAISSRAAVNQTAVRQLMDRLIPNDAEFEAAFYSYGDVSTSRAKYLLAMLEKAQDQKKGLPEKPLEWHSRAVTIEHILPQSQGKSNEDDAAVVQKLGNLTLLEKRYNKNLGSAAFAQKREAYKQSSFALTAQLSSRRTWSHRSINDRTKELATLANFAWPAN